MCDITHANFWVHPMNLVLKLITTSLINIKLNRIINTNEISDNK